MFILNLVYIHVLNTKYLVVLLLLQERLTFKKHMNPHNFPIQNSGGEAACSLSRFLLISPITLKQK